MSPAPHAAGVPLCLPRALGPSSPLARFRPLVHELAAPPSPVAAFAALRSGDEPFFLDGARDHHGQGRYSFLGCDPFLTIRAKGARVVVATADGRHEEAGNPFRVLQHELRRYALPYYPRPLPFVGGVVGYFSYDLKQHVERLPVTAVDDLGFPDLALGFYDTVLAYDQLQGRAFLCALPLPGRPPAEQRVEALAARLRSAPEPPAPELAGPVAANLRGNFGREEYVAAISRVKDYIAAGDIFQVNLSQRFSADLHTDPWALYRRLRTINPAPFAGLLLFRDGVVASASPERFLRVRGRWVETRPIKGTRPRGTTPEEDDRLARELLASEKDRAELVMIVDLERNDLGRVCSYGTVRVPELVRLESYATVHHLVSTVIGRLHDTRDTTDLLRATFPGGSITGAPKVRSMEIIDELEPTQRAVYTGSIGWIGFDGEMDLNIVIRTYLVRDGMVHWQVGGGIVADSDPEAEYQETLDKARALRAALGL